MAASAKTAPVSGVSKPQITAAKAPAKSRFGNLGEIGVPLAVLGIVMAMITPLPSFLLDILISANITIAVIVLLVSMYITKPVEFSIFPTALLLLTLFRLALNISSSRLILIQGNSGTRAAGQVIEAFGNFVVGGNYIIGVVIFLVMIAIQYVVINHGAVRISEVTARFTLDAMPGKQMSIDSDLNAASSTSMKRGRVAKIFRPRRSFTGRWTAPRGSRSATRSRAFSSPPSISLRDF